MDADKMRSHSGAALEPPAVDMLLLYACWERRERDFLLLIAIKNK